MPSLTPGSVARIYRGEDLVAPAFDIPASGRVELRNLQPGQYLIRDECGREEAIEVTAFTEVVRIGGRGGETGPVAAADSTRPMPAAEVVVELEPIFPSAQSPANIDVDALDPEGRVQTDDAS